MLEAAIFSYNRLEHLRTAVDSARANLPSARIGVFDDRSTDPAMLAYLDSLGEMVVRADENLNARHGGLYANMQRAVEMAEGRYLLILQEDFQVVRPVVPVDFDEISTIFASDARCAFLSVLFMPRGRMRRYRRQLAPDTAHNVYDAPSTHSPRNFGRRLLIIGATGLGKSWFACALGHNACCAGRPVLYQCAPRMFEALALALGDGRHERILKTFARMDVLIIDYWGLAVLTAPEGCDLLEIIDDRHGRATTIVTSQLPVEYWHEAIGDPTLADAILDRLDHNAHRPKLTGESMRKASARNSSLYLSAQVGFHEIVGKTNCPHLPGVDAHIPWNAYSGTRSA